MKKVALILLLFAFIGTCAHCADLKRKVIVNDFRNVNLLETFYVYDLQKNDYVFVPLDFSAYQKLSKENKEIYKKVENAQELMEKAENTPFNLLKIRYRQTAYKKNPYLISAANALITDFEKEKKYSTALYYALQVKEKDKKGKYPNINYKTGSLYHQLKLYDESTTDLKKHLEVKNKNSAYSLDTFVLLADNYYQKAQKEKNPNPCFKQALIYADKALALNKNNYTALQIKYDICYEFQSYKTAMNVSAKLMELNPSDYSNALKYANCRAALNDKKTELIYLYKAKRLADKFGTKEDKEKTEHINLRITNLEAVPSNVQPKTIN